ncbi:MAG TPA: SLC13 family permease, partial [Candidatus Limnocylindrales bacterium]|nr:SLC13 family permease [Candidatus Limnocylindrales bacterium]
MRWGTIPVASSWEQIISWLVLSFVLYAVATGKIRFEAAAFGGLLFLGLLGIGQPETIFSGFASNALFTVATVLVMSAGLVESGILNGLGKRIAMRVHKPENQILTISLATGCISAFMNNVGAIGVILPTAQRMAKRAGIDKSFYGMPLVYAALLGGSITLIGVASNIIVSAFRMQAFGQPFRMFDFTAHGLTMAGTGLLLWFVCRLCGYRLITQEIKDPIPEASLSDDEARAPQKLIQPAAQRNARGIFIVAGTLIPVILLSGMGLVHPSIGFGFVVLIMLGTGILHYEKAFQALNIPAIIFLGSMLSLARIMIETGALAAAINQLMPLVIVLPAVPLILAFVFITAVLSNILNNSVAALLMAPTAIII